MVSNKSSLFKAAIEGDTEAKKIIIRAGEEIGISVRALFRRLDLGSIPCEVVLSGSVYKGEGSLLLDTVRKTIRSEFKLAEAKKPLFELVVGALLKSFDEIDDNLDPTLMRNILSTLPRLLILGNKTN